MLRDVVSTGLLVMNVRWICPAGVKAEAMHESEAKITACVPNFYIIDDSGDYE